MVRRSAVAAREPYAVAYPLGATLPELTRWLRELTDLVDDGTAETGLLLTLGGDGGQVASAEVAEWTRWEKAVGSIERLPVPAVGAVDGLLTGPAFQLFLALDLVVVSPRTVIACRDLEAGQLPGMALHRLAKYTGLGHAKRMVLTGEPVCAVDALARGLVTEVSAEPMTTVRSLLLRHAGAGPAWYLARRLLSESYYRTTEDAVGGVLAAQERVLREGSGATSGP